MKQQKTHLLLSLTSVIKKFLTCVNDILAACFAYVIDTSKQGNYRITPRIFVKKIEIVYWHVYWDEEEQFYNKKTGSENSRGTLPPPPRAGQNKCYSDRQREGKIWG
jgi:hypothetical protein